MIACDKDIVKAAAVGRWREVARGLGIGEEYLTGNHGPCPKCGGTDRWRIYDDFDETGGAICNKCGQTIGDGLALVQWWSGCDFQAAVERTGIAMGVVAGGEGGEWTPPPPADPILALAQAKGIPSRDAVVAYGAQTTKDGGVVFPAYGPTGEQCTTFTIKINGTPKERKGKFANGLKAGLFFPHENGRVRLPRAGETWCVVEGVKDAATLYSLGYLAVGLNTCALATKFAQLFRGVDVVLVPDRDTASMDGAVKTGGVLYGQVAKTLLAILPAQFSATNGKDVRDVLRMTDGESLIRQCISSAQPQEISTLPDEITNCIERDKSGPVPMGMRDIIATVNKATSEWPRRVAGSLFVHTGDDVQLIKTESALFGYFHSLANVHWTRGAKFVTKAELFAEMQRTARQYNTVEPLPHEPLLPNHYYTCGEVQPGNGDHLRRLVDRFSPETDIDRDLILAAFVTPGWGGPAGTRPAFCITSDYGRGMGKTKVAEFVGMLWNGVLSFSQKEDIGKIKTRLLTPEAMTRRVALLDNVKSLKFSWGELEAMVTSDTIGGHRMYCGDGTRPNTLTWFITLNGASLSTDMAQRSVVIKLAKPTRSGSWYDDTREYVERNRQAIIADVVGFLRSDPVELTQFSRWSNWERDVLARLPEPADAQRVIEERQVGVDVEGEEAEILEEFFAAKVKWLGYRDDEWVFIPNAVATQWYNIAQTDKLTTSQVTRTMGQYATEGRLKRLQPKRLNIWRGYLWCGGPSPTGIALDLEDRLTQRQGR